jgi:membrane-bound inhibitor of C-type lysozyme
MHDRIIKDWPYVRGYVIKDQHLFLALMADGGTYEFEPLAGPDAIVAAPHVKSRGPFGFQCTRQDAETQVLEELNVTFYQTEPALVLVERAGRKRPAFQVQSGSGAKFEGEELSFWDKGEQAMAVWSGMKLACKRRP